jgi:hypothetical protein
MPSVSLNILLNFIAARGTARVAVATLPEGNYDPRKDFYKRLRERTVRQFVEGWNPQHFRRATQRLAAPRKRASFEACRAGLTEWAEGRRITARRPPRLTWATAGLEVRVNPELRLDVDGRPFLAKLYFKAHELDHARRDNILCLLSETTPPGVEAAILDARRGELITANDLDPNLDALLVAEAAAFAALLTVCQDDADTPSSAAELPPLRVAA